MIGDFREVGNRKLEAYFVFSESCRDGPKKDINLWPLQVYGPCSHKSQNNRNRTILKPWENVVPLVWADIK